jgi:hypothetical protein
MTKKFGSWILGLALILTLLLTPGLSSASSTDDAAIAPAANAAKLTLAGVDGPGWVLRTPATAPAVRFEHAMSYDSARGVIVLFGGRDGSNYFNDTWEWDGNDWLLRSPVTAPPARFNHAMAYDAARGVTVLFGGYDSNWQRTNETWEWDGSNWVQCTPQNVPPTRVYPAMTYDAVRQVTVLFGGHRYDGGHIYLNDTWEWDGTDWVERTPLTAPSGRVTSGIAYDAAREVTVLFGGFSIATGLMNDTWEWDGTDWVQCTPANAPTARENVKVAYDSEREVTVLFGGDDLSGDLNDTWEWDSTDWVQRTSPNAPSARSAHAIAYDSIRGVTVLFGGSSLVNDTWEYSGRWMIYTPLIIRY